MLLLLFVTFLFLLAVFLLSVWLLLTLPVCISLDLCLLSPTRECGVEVDEAVEIARLRLQGLDQSTTDHECCCYPSCHYNIYALIASRYASDRDHEISTGPDHIF